MNLQKPVFCIAVITLLGVVSVSDAVAQKEWSLKVDQSFNPTKPRPLTPSTNKARPVAGSGSRRLQPQATNQVKTTPTRQSRSTSDRSYYDLPICHAGFIDDVELPAQESGVLLSMLAKEGQSFKRGQTIAKIDDQLYRQMLKQAEMQRDMALKRATDMTSIRAGRYKVKLATVEAEKAQKLLTKGSKSESEYRRARYSQRVAQEELIAAENERDMAANEARLENAKVEEVNARIRRHSIQTDFDGYVIEKFRDAGEWVQAGEKVLRVGRMDRLRVRGTISSKEFNPFEVANKPVTVTLQMARGKTTSFKGKIVSVGLEKQGSEMFVVKAEVNNRLEQGSWTLLPGSQVEMRIHLEENADLSMGSTAASASTDR